MRLNPRVGVSAADFLESASEESIIRAVRDYGEERRWRKVVQAIISAVARVLSERSVLQI